MQSLAGLLLFAAGVVFSSTTLASREPLSQPKQAPPEAQLLQALSAIQTGHYDNALQNLSALIETQPNFRLAQYVYGQLMVARTGNGIDPALHEKLEGVRLAMVDEVRTRWNHHRRAGTHDGLMPAAILKLTPEYKHAIVVDLDNNRLYLFANDDGLPRLIGDFYATIGSQGAGKQVAGDNRTPIGIYTITTYRSGDKLPELYGTGAFPINYPNAYDKLRGRTGYGIWIHGVPQSTYARAPRASEGCVAVANDVFQWLRKYVKIGATPVILVHQVQWLTAAEAEARREAIIGQLKGWVQSWEAIDTKKYMTYYADDFKTFDGIGKAAFGKQKYSINANKKSIRVDISQLSIFRYPGSDGAPMLKLSFVQDYRSDNFDWRGVKIQFWRQQDGESWRIALERSHS